MVEHQSTRGTLDLEGFPPKPPLELGSGGLRVLSHESWRNRGGKRFGQVCTPAVWGKETYFLTGLFGWDLSLLLRHRPHKRQLLPGIHPRAQRSPGQGREERLCKPGRGGAKARICGSWGTHGSDLGAAALRTRCSDVPGALERRCSPGSQPRSARSCAAPSPPCGRQGPAAAAPARVDSVLEDQIAAAARPDLPLGPNRPLSSAVGAGRDAREGASRLGAEGGGAGSRSGEPAVHHRPRPPAPHAHHPCGAAPVGGPMCAPPAGSGYWQA